MKGCGTVGEWDRSKIAIRFLNPTAALLSQTIPLLGLGNEVRAAFMGGFYVVAS